MFTCYDSLITRIHSFEKELIYRLHNILQTHDIQYYFYSLVKIRGPQSSCRVNFLELKRIFSRILKVAKDPK